MIVFSMLLPYSSCLYLQFFDLGDLISDSGGFFKLQFSGSDKHLGFEFLDEPLAFCFGHFVQFTTFIVECSSIFDFEISVKLSDCLVGVMLCSLL